MKDFPAYGKVTSRGRLVRTPQENSPLASARFLLALALRFGMALFFAAQRIEYIRTERRIKILMLQKRKATEATLPIMLEVQYLSRLERVEQVAKNSLFMAPPSRYRIINPRPVEPETKALETKEEAPQLNESTGKVESSPVPDQ